MQRIEERGKKMKMQNLPGQCKRKSELPGLQWEGRMSNIHHQEEEETTTTIAIIAAITEIDLVVLETITL